jgi:uncharacterized BrkB/YihY/UPF0761 family membrane protein
MSSNGAIQGPPGWPPPVDEDRRGDMAPPEPSGSSWLQGLRQRGVDSLERAQTWADAARQHSAPVDAAVTLIGRFRLIQLSLVTGYVALRCFILLFPLAYVLIAGLGLVASEEDALDATSSVGISDAVAESIADAAASSSRGHWVALIIGLMATAWAGRGALRALRIAHAEAWRIPLPKVRYSSYGGLPLAAALVVIVIVNGWLVQLGTDGMSRALVFALQGALFGVLWLGVSLIMPRGERTSWLDLIPGALLWAVAAPALNFAVTIYFAPRLARTQETYGALGVGVVVLAYLLAIAWMVALAAELNSGLHAWRQTRRATGTG